MVQRTLKGCLWLKGTPTSQKWALTLDDLGDVINHYQTSTFHDNLLFVAMLVTGLFALMRLGELTFPNNPAVRNWRKVIQHSSVVITDDHYEFFLPAHKTDRFFKGNKIVVMAKQFCHQPLHHFCKYIASRDSLLPLASPLWLTVNVSIPTRSFFITCIRLFFDNKVAVNQCVLVVQCCLQNMVSPLLSFKGWDSSHPRCSRFMFEKAQQWSSECCWLTPPTHLNQRLSYLFFPVFWLMLSLYSSSIFLLIPSWLLDIYLICASVSVAATWLTASQLAWAAAPGTRQLSLT